MKLTNKYNLPQTFMNVMERPTYTKGKAHISATELLNSPRIVQLRHKFDDQIVTDVSDNIWSIIGTAIHGVLEQGKDPNHIVEQRLHSVFDGWHISGAIDLQIVHDDGVEINDYKNVGVWSVMNEKIEWEQQLNIYAWLVETVKKTPVNKLAIVAIIRDWNRRDAKSRQGYPQSAVAVLDVKLWSMEEREEFIRSRIHLHSEALYATDTGEVLPLCTAGEMWEKPTSYAVKKEGSARAKSVHAEKIEAEEALQKAGKGYILEVREGERTRCANFCPVSEFCDQYKLYQEEKNGNKAEEEESN
jgi:hypothetical protein